MCGGGEPSLLTFTANARPEERSTPCFTTANLPLQGAKGGNRAAPHNAPCSSCYAGVRGGHAVNIGEQRGKWRAGRELPATTAVPSTESPSLSCVWVGVYAHGGTPCGATVLRPHSRHSPDTHSEWVTRERAPKASHPLWVGV